MVEISAPVAEQSNESTPPVLAPRKQLSWSLGAMSCWEMLEVGGFVSACMWHLRQPYAI